MVALNTEHMYMALLSHKICGNPGFPAIPMWHKDYAAQLELRKFVLQIKEISKVGFFYHGRLFGEIFCKICKNGQYPTPAQPQSYSLKSKLENYKSLRKLGAHERGSETNRLICCKIGKHI